MGAGDSWWRGILWVVLDRRLGNDGCPDRAGRSFARNLGPVCVFDRGCVLSRTGRPGQTCGRGVDRWGYYFDETLIAARHRTRR